MDMIFMNEVLQNQNMRIGITRTIRDRSNPFVELDDAIFQQRFRLTKTSVLMLLNKIGVAIEHETNHNHALPPMLQLLITLRFYATGTFQIVMGDLVGVHKSTVCRAIKRVSIEIARLRPQYVKFPQTDDEILDTMKAFYAIAQFPGVLGAVDSTHIAIQSPGGDNAEIFLNRKGYFSINVQCISNANLIITDIVARGFGSAHDMTVFSNCERKASFETGEIQSGHLLGDNGYAVKPYLLTPLQNPTTRPQQRYNISQISTRNTVERMFGVWKRRFACLKYGIRLKLDNVLTVIVATSVLHNMLLGQGEAEPTNDEELNLYIMEQRRNRRAFRVYEDVDDDIVRLPDILPAGNRQTITRDRIIQDYFTW